MDLADVNVLVHAHREDAPDHTRCHEWVSRMLASPRAYAVSDLVLSGFIRVVTHPRIFREPSPVESALAFVSEIRDRPNAVPVAPGPRHWSIFLDLVEGAGARGNLIPDAYLAALAIESGCEWVTTDRDFARFDELRWRHPGEAENP